MKTSTIIISIVCVSLLAGCAQHYRLTLTNGNSISTNTKPRLNPEGSAFVFKDRTGKLTSVPVGKVREVEPE